MFNFVNKTFNLENKILIKEKRRLDFIFIGLMSFLKIGFIVSMNLWLKPAQADLLTQRFVYWPIEHFYPGAKLCRINIYIFNCISGCLLLDVHHLIHILHLVTTLSKVQSIQCQVFAFVLGNEVRHTYMYKLDPLYNV